MSKKAVKELLRAKAEEQHAKVIYDVYSRVESTDSENVPDEDVGQYILCMVEKIAANNTRLADERDMFSYGIDSVSTVQISDCLRKVCVALI